MLFFFSVSDLLGSFCMQHSSLVQWEQKCSAVCLGIHAGSTPSLQRGGTVLCSGLGRPAPSPDCCGEGLVGNLCSTAATPSWIVPLRWL